MLLLGLCSAFLVGLVAGVWHPLPAPSGALVAAVVASLGAFAGRRRPRPRWLGLATAAAALGVLRASAVRAAEPPNPLLELAGTRLVLEGTVTTVPVRAGATIRFTLAGTGLAAPGGPNKTRRQGGPLPPGPDAAAREGQAAAAREGQAAAAREGQAAAAREGQAAAAREGQAAAARQGQAAAAHERLAAAARAPEGWVDVVDRADGVAGTLGLGDRVRAEGRLRLPGAPADPAGSGPTQGPAGPPAPADAGTAATGGAVTGYGRQAPELLFPRLVRLEAATTIDPRGVAAGLRAEAARAVHRWLPEPEGSLAVGVLLGGGGQLDPDFRQQLQRSGLAHLLAVDGYKQVVVSGALQAVTLRLLGRRLAVPSILLGVTAYTLLTGASPSAVRAGLMVALSVVAGVVGRVSDPLTGLLLAAALMGAVHPLILLELAFQLSFSATLGLILFYPRVGMLLRGLPHLLAAPAGLTLAVTLATLPITLLVFQSLSIVSPLAHVLAVPLVPAVLGGTALLILAQPSPDVAALVAGACWLPTTLLVQVIRVFGGLPGAALSTGQIPLPAATALALALLAWGLWALPDVWRPRRWVRRSIGRQLWLWDVGTPLAVVAVGLVAAGLILLVRPDGRLHLVGLGLRRGDAVLVRGPGGATALVVDGAVDSRELAERVRSALTVWERSLDLAVVVDPADEPRLADTLRQYPTGQLVDASSDARLDLGGGAVLDLFARASPAVMVGYGDVSIPLKLGHAGELVSDGSAVWVGRE